MNTDNILKNCPKCNKKLDLPIYENEQTCPACGWTNKPEKIKKIKIKSIKWLSLLKYSFISTLVGLNIGMLYKLHQLSNFSSKIAVNLDRINLTLEKPEPESKYEYKVVSPSDSEFDDELSFEGQLGWKVVTCRRASDSLKIFSYECIMMKEQK